MSTPQVGSSQCIQIFQLLSVISDSSRPDIRVHVSSGYEPLHVALSTTMYKSGVPVRSLPQVHPHIWVSPGRLSRPLSGVLAPPHTTALQQRLPPATSKTFLWNVRNVSLLLSGRSSTQKDVLSERQILWPAPVEQAFQPGTKGACVRRLTLATFHSRFLSRIKWTKGRVSLQHMHACALFSLLNHKMVSGAYHTLM